MAEVLTPAERRVARLLVAGILLGVLWHTWEGLAPPPPPLVFEHNEPSAGTTVTGPLHEAPDARVYEETTPSFPVDLNGAGEAELMTLPGIGPVLARRIVAWREQRGRITSPEELLEVNGIGPTVLARIRDLVALDRGAPAPRPPRSQGPAPGGASRP